MNENNRKHEYDLRMKMCPKIQMNPKMQEYGELLGPLSCFIVKTNATQSNSKATSDGVRHSSHLKPTTPPQTFQPLLDQLEN